ncbi:MULTISPECIES: hypothetical protein [unclassified Aureimonas]|uniref:hypothetical protein n=1 Tax=unclassified Aureimonas TaxID=2615206 RepID=UPI0006F633E8|nr:MULTISPECIES: hypothetical protein [unclassified Aureimonas]KQT53800.1 hypothetical protein ASG62_11150 [Aureimonas sp. Leaf427]KQT71759.1 hypothetical protein ASG54_20010 [Aureimonas sp. Leaf460]
MTTIERTRLALPERRFLNSRQAADYLAVSPNVFQRECPVAPVRFGAVVRWDRKALDTWLDGLTKTEANLSGDDWLGMMDDAAAGT